MLSGVFIAKGGVRSMVSIELNVIDVAPIADDQTKVRVDVKVPDDGTSFIFEREVPTGNLNEAVKITFLALEQFASALVATAKQHYNESPQYRR